MYLLLTKISENGLLLVGTILYILSQVIINMSYLNQMQLERRNTSHGSDAELDLYFPD